MIGRAIIFKIEVIFVFVIIGYAVFRLMMIRLFLLYSQVGYLLGSEVIGAKHFITVFYRGCVFRLISGVFLIHYVFAVRIFHLC